MDIAFIDYLANTKAGAMRKCGIASKLFLCLSCLSVCLCARSLTVLISVPALLLVFNLISGMPPCRLMHFLFYPVFFSLAFVFMRLFSDPYDAAVILLKATASVLSMVLLLITTPFTDLFSFLGAFLPKVIVSSLFFAYRIFFMLLQKLSDSLKNMRLRGKFGLSHSVFYLKSIAGVLGSVFISAVDMSERMSVIYAIRGFNGRIYTKNSWRRFSAYDILPVLTGIAVICLGIFARPGGAL